MPPKVFVAPLPAEDEADDADFELTPELMEFAEGVRQTAIREWGAQPRAALIESPLQWLFAALRQAYDNRLAILLQRARNAGENTRLSRALAEACRRNCGEGFLPAGGGRGCGGAYPPGCGAM